MAYPSTQAETVDRRTGSVVGSAEPVPGAGADTEMALWTSRIVFVTLILWTLGAGSGGPDRNVAATAGPLRHIIYSLPFTLGLGYYLSFGRGRLRADDTGIGALTSYGLLALAAMASNSWLDFHAVRDVAIVCGYLLLSAFWFRAPAWVAERALAALAVCMLIEFASRMGSDVSAVGEGGIYSIIGLTNPDERTLFGSHGILESTLGFPLGVVLLYFVNNRQWRLAALSGFLLLVAFKRISFVGAALALTFDAVLSSRLSSRNARWLALVAVVLLSAIAIASIYLFEDVANNLELEDSSADAVSLGRYDIALMLWDRLHHSGPLNWLIGFGPGAADAIVENYTILQNPHNDWLKILFDYGAIGFVAIHSILFANLARHRLGLMIYIYTATLMVTDNVFIYMFYHAYVALIMCTARK